MSLSNVQIGKIVEDEFAKFAMLGSKGRIDLYRADTDDEGIDFEAHVKDRYWLPLALQIKGSTHLHDDILQPSFIVADTVVAHDLLYYVFAYLDRKELGVSRPFFVVPSKLVLARHSSHAKQRGYRLYKIEASVRPDSRDQWSPYRVMPSQLGRRLMEILKDAERMGMTVQAAPSSLFRIPGTRFAGVARKSTSRRPGLSLVQEGIISQNEFAKLAILTSNGRLEVNPAKTDDENRDFEIHKRNDFGRHLSIQVKSRYKLLLRPTGKAALSILVAAGGRGRRKLPIHPDFLYFLAYFDPRVMRFRAQFLVPSSVLHSPKAQHYGYGWSFAFLASIEPDSHDKWVPFRIHQKDLGRTLLQLLKSDQLTSTEAA